MKKRKRLVRFLSGPFPSIRLAWVISPGDYAPVSIARTFFRTRNSPSCHVKVAILRRVASWTYPNQYMDDHGVKLLGLIHDCFILYYIVLLRWNTTTKSDILFTSDIFIGPNDTADDGRSPPLYRFAKIMAVILAHCNAKASERLAVDDRENSDPNYRTPREM